MIIDYKTVNTNDSYRNKNNNLQFYIILPGNDCQLETTNCLTDK